jgi:2-polyprenyl-3-methyl-5-hydroxy-6-metoxy-1,4-benzoquinol methylase
MNQWDERFSSADFVYGTAPNQWLAANASRIASGGRILSLGEGEGRNAVWLAEQGFLVDAVDASPVGLEKARRLAASRKVFVSTTLADLATYSPEPGKYDAVVLVFIHLPPAIRGRVHALAQAALKPGGVVIIEAFTPRQLTRSSGGPKKLDMLFEAAMLRADFPAIAWESLEELDTDLAEGSLHRGSAAVVRGLGRLGENPQLRGCF